MRTVFVADDDQLMREIVARTLRKSELCVRTFTSAQSLLDRFDAECPHLIISDIRMPGMTGLELAETLRRRGSQVPIILMTAHVSPAVERAARNLHVEHLVPKPIKDMADFVGCVHAAMDDPLLDAEIPGLDAARVRSLTRLAHELRTPLTAIRAALDGLIAERPLNGDQRRIANIGRRNLDRLARLVERELGHLQAEITDALAPGEDLVEPVPAEPEYQR
jgi:two-component system response regulator FixJ